jgi:hypothetical protein
MEIEALKEALGDEKFKALQSFVDGLKSQRDEARQESISGRKGLKDKLSQLESAQSRLMEKLGVDSLDDLDSLPDAKGSAEAAKQYEAKVKRLERELSDSAKTRDEAVGKYKSGLQKVAISEALSGHDFVARDIIESYVSQRLAWEGDDLYFKSEDGKLMPVKDGVASVAKSRPELLKAAGTGGAGVRQSNAGGNGGAKTMARADFDQLPPQQRMALAKEGVQLT